MSMANWCALIQKTVLGAMGRGDKDAAVKLRERYVDAPGEWARLRGVISDMQTRVTAAA